MSTNWKWRLVNQGTFDEYVTPSYGDKTLNHKIEGEMVFLRPTWDGNMFFYRGDYTLIKDSLFGTEFELILEQLVNDVYIEKFTFSFTKADCEISENINREYVKVKPKIDDRYEDILNDYDTDINVIENNNDSTTIYYYQKPIIQVYLNGATKISNYIDKTYFEQAVTSPTSDEDLLTGDYQFKKLGEYLYSPGSETPSGLYVKEATAESNFDDFAVLFARNTGNTKGIYVYKSNLKFRVSNATLDDTDFASVWLYESHQIKFVKRTGNFLYFFIEDDFEDYRRIPRFQGTITHISNGVHTTPINYQDVVHENKIRMAIHAAGTYELGFQSPSDWLFLGVFNQDDQGTERVVRPDIPDVFDYIDTRSSPGFQSSVLYTQVIGGSGQVKVFDISIYSRLITNLQKVNNTETVLLPADDLVSPISNYERVAPVSVGFTIIDINIGADQGWGQVPDNAANGAGNYWIRPATPAIAVSESLPIVQSLWVDYTAWMYFTKELYDTQTGIKQLVTLEKAYTLKSLIGSLLAEFAPNVIFNESTLHSKFYYEVDNSIRGKYRKLFFTPKTNVSLKGTKSANLGDLSFAKLFNFLWNTHKVKWYITENNELVLEHIEFFRNGLSYNAPIVGIDVTGIQNTRNQKTYDFDTLTYTFRKEGIPKRLKYNWMDDVSFFFTGDDIIVKSNYAKQDLNLTPNLSPFTSDLNFVLANANDINKDGFMALETCVEDGKDVVAEYMTQVNGDDVKIQNGYLSFVYLHSAYHIYDAPAKDLNINKSDIEATSIKRNRIQKDVRYPGTITEYMSLCKTSLGVGKIIESKENLDTLITDLIIEHDTE